MWQDPVAPKRRGPDDSNTPPRDPSRSQPSCQANHVNDHLANARSKVGATTTAQLVWILAPRLPEPEGAAADDD